MQDEHTPDLKADLTGRANWSLAGRTLKRTFDIGFVFVALPFCIPACLIAILAIKIDSRGPVIYSTDRVGKNARLFRLYKFRSMNADPSASGPGLTYSGDPRITRVGRWLRRTKFDEFPQILNVLKGEMSIVGPRPEAPEYVDHYTDMQRTALAVRPGLTSLAQVAYRDEEELIPAEDPVQYYLDEIMPRKLEFDAAYVLKWNIWMDMKIFLAGLAALFRFPTGFGLDSIVDDDGEPDRV
jgi:lipopolysaccharide/colanic/teichoic acid biosynthesis glycosyltransferase